MSRATVADFRAAYSEFVDTADETVERYLEESTIYVGPNWGDDEARGNMLYTAHVLTDAGQSAALSRTTSISSGSHKTTFSAVDGLGLSSTRYGVAFMALQSRYTGHFIAAV